MGVVHKLKPEVLSFIIEHKQNNPTLSCRHLTALIFEQLQVKVSKSSINAIFKENNLSMPIGRRSKLKKKKFPLPALPVIDEVKVIESVDLPQGIVQDQVAAKLEAEKAAAELARIKAQEEAKLRDLEKAAQEAKEKIKQEEAARKLEEEKAAVELAKIKAQEEARLKELERLAQEAEENKRKQEQAAKLEAEKAAAELARIKAQEEAKLRDLEKAAQEAKEKIKQEEAARKLEEEKAAVELAKIKAQEEARLKELERLAQEAEENKRKQEQAAKLEAEKAAAELARIKAQEEAKLRDLEKAAQEAKEKIKQEEAARKLEEEKAAVELAKIKAQEEARLKELERLAQEAEENKRKQEQAAKLEAEKAAAELARIKAQEEAKLRDLEKAAQEAKEKIKQEEAARKLEEEKAAVELAKIKAQEEARLKELERLAQEAEENKRKQEQAAKLEAEKAAAEAELAAERERWARLAEQEQKAKHPPSKEEVAMPKVEPVTPEILPENRACTGAIIIKALDCLIGGSREINAAINRAIGGSPQESFNLTEALIFRSLFGKDGFSALGDLIGVRYSQEKLSNYYAQVKQLTDIGVDTAKIILNVFTEAKGVKVNFIDGSVIHLDGQLYSSWPATRFPHDFSNIASDLRKNLNKYFIQGAPLVLFAAPGYDIFPKDFFSLLLNFASKDNYPESLTLFGNQSEEMDKIGLSQQKRCDLIFGLFPWQFTSSRKVKKIGDFSLKHIKEINRDLYLGEIEITLFRASLNQSITLKGCAVKTDLKEKICLVILNSGEQAMSLDGLAGIYLSHWPNFEEVFQDFSRKIEFFTYAGAEQKFFSKDSFGMDTAGLTIELAGILANYIKMLDAYLRWHFLPVDYREKDLTYTSDCFYKLPVELAVGQDKLGVKTLVSQEYQFLKDLEYLNSRLNERKINASSGKLFGFESAFK